MSESIALSDFALVVCALLLWGAFGAAPALVGLVIGLVVRALIYGLV